jgi:hypothetical protein
MSENTMPRPIDLPLLFDGVDDPTHVERDERSPGVVLLSVGDDGETKMTAERRGDAWLVCDWELTDDLTPPLDGRFWYVCSSFTIPVSLCERLADISRGAA